VLNVSQFTPEARGGILARLAMGMRLVRVESVQAVGSIRRHAAGSSAGHRESAGTYRDFAADVDAAGTRGMVKSRSRPWSGPARWRQPAATGGRCEEGTLHEREKPESAIRFAWKAETLGIALGLL